MLNLLINEKLGFIETIDRIISKIKIWLNLHVKYF
jgi:hypothetical protein